MWPSPSNFDLITPFDYDSFQDVPAPIIDTDADHPEAPVTKHVGLDGINENILGSDSPNTAHIKSSTQRTCSQCISRAIKCDFQLGSSSCQQCLRRGRACTPLAYENRNEKLYQSNVNFSRPPSSDSTQEREKLGLDEDEDHPQTFRREEKVEPSGNDGRFMVLSQYRALYDYDTQDPSCPPFRRGDIITVLAKMDSGWWDGVLENQRGWFPSNYFKEETEPFANEWVPPPSWNPDPHVLGKDPLSFGPPPIPQFEPPNDPKSISDLAFAGLTTVVGTTPRPADACSRCRGLKVKCEFDTRDGACRRCLSGGYPCYTPGRKERGLPLRKSISEESPGKPLMQGACLACKRMKLRCQFGPGATKCRRCLTGGYGCVVAGRLGSGSIGASASVLESSSETSQGIDIPVKELVSDLGLRSSTIKGQLEESPNKSSYRKSCSRCRSLKVKCEFAAGTERCRRCSMGVHKCDIKKISAYDYHPGATAAVDAAFDASAPLSSLSDNESRVSRGPTPAFKNTQPPLYDSTQKTVASSSASKFEVHSPVQPGLVERAWTESSQCITANRALAHISNFEDSLKIAFADVKFRNKYKIQVGFNESILAQGALAEEIYLLLDGELNVPEAEVYAAFGAVFAPFPGIVYTHKQDYHIAVDPQAGTIQALNDSPKVTTANNGATHGSGGARNIGQSRSRGVGNRRGNQRSNQDTEKRTVGGEGDDGGSDGDSDDDDDDSEDERPRRGIPKGDGDHKGKKPVIRGARVVNIPFGSTLCLTSDEGSHQVNTVAAIDITVNDNDKGLSPPPDSRWSGPWFEVDMTEFEVTSVFVDQPTYLLSLAQVQMTACSSDSVGLIDRSPKHLRADGDSAKKTLSKNKSFNIGTVLGVSPTAQAGFSFGKNSGMETKVGRWDVSSHKVMNPPHMKVQKEDVSEGALWKYTHNDGIFGRVEGFSFNRDLRPSGVFSFSKARTEVEVKVTVFWSSGIESSSSKPGGSFPFRWRRAKDQMSVFANFIYQVAVIADLEKVEEERSWIMPKNNADDVPMKELSKSMGPIHFEPVIAEARSPSEGPTKDMAGLEVLISRAVEGRAKLTTAERIGAAPLMLQPPSNAFARRSIEKASILPTPSPSPPPELHKIRHEPNVDDDPMRS